MRVTVIDATDEAALAAYCALVRETGRDWMPEGLPASERFLAGEVRSVPPNEVRPVFGAWDGGTLVGAAMLRWWEEPDNRDRAWLHFEVRDAAPIDALAAEAAAFARPHGRTLLNVETPVGSAASEWVRARGGRVGSLEEYNVTRLAALDRDDVAALAAATPDGYELVRWEGPAPDDTIEAFVALANTMNDAPRDDLTMEDWSFTTARARIWEESLAARGHVPWTLVARHAATGELAGYNQLVVRPEWPEVVQNEDTAVARAHRGHGLGLWVKAANLLRVMTELPEAQCVETWNAASNAHMLRVNRRLGFVCERTWESWELEAESA